MKANYEVIANDNAMEQGSS